MNNLFLALLCYTYMHKFPCNYYGWLLYIYINKLFIIHCFAFRFVNRVINYSYCILYFMFKSIYLFFLKPLKKYISLMQCILITTMHSSIKSIIIFCILQYFHLILSSVAAYYSYTYNSHNLSSWFLLTAIGVLGIRLICLFSLTAA